jgi:hypothetical protein
MGRRVSSAPALLLAVRQFGEWTVLRTLDGAAEMAI